MSNLSPAPLQSWLTMPLSSEVAGALERLRRFPDVQHVAVMPDVHLAAEVCVGVVVATSSLIYPQAVGGDIGCGMLAVGFNQDAIALKNPRLAALLLKELGKAIPTRRHNRASLLQQPENVIEGRLSHPSLEALRSKEGVLEFGTLGSGNHFLELQTDEENRLWLMIHSGSRALGPAIRNHHLAQAPFVAPQLRALEADSKEGADYLNDASWAMQFAEASRKAMAYQAGEVLFRLLGCKLAWETAITTNHNHVVREAHGERTLWVHRKGAMSAQLDQQGVLPGSMGTQSFHVVGRGHADALCSSAHGAGRSFSRSEARSRFTNRDVELQMEGVWYDYRLTRQLKDEAPGAYKDIRKVLKAQREMVKVVRTLRPLLSYKGI